ncbi:MAG TPA: twin-arginine translocase TatA/TatE family subunit [Candidatus Deferrimicrobiaceae bacterium]
MFGIGFQEMLIILVVVLIFFGPKRLPDLAKSLGKGIAEFKKASEEVRKGIEEAVKEESTGEGGKSPESPTPQAHDTAASAQPQETAVPSTAVTDTTPAEGEAQKHPAPGAGTESATDAATPRPG